MVRVTNAPASRRRRKRLLKRAKGFWGDRKNHVRQTHNAVMSALSFNTKHRKLKKRDFRSLWITRIGVGAKINGLSYSRLIHGLQKARCELNRKMLSEMAIHDPAAFSTVANLAKEALAS
ncbi:MAG: 50S ribosomal protein L20 [Chlamydiae bacterium]|nr:50S ribosomal protein L20 [Chlamydiota bacterium]